MNGKNLLIGLGLVGAGFLGYDALSENGSTKSSVAPETVNRIEADTYSGGDKDCADFSTHAEAQDFFESAGAGDPHRLDRDGDGSACETLP